MPSDELLSINWYVEGGGFDSEVNIVPSSESDNPEHKGTKNSNGKDTKNSNSEDAKKIEVLGVLAFPLCAFVHRAFCRRPSLTRIE